VAVDGSPPLSFSPSVTLRPRAGVPLLVERVRSR
jgi:hypothetical protein